MSVAVVHDVSCDENDDRKNALALCSSLELSFSHDHDQIQLPVISANEHSCASQSPMTHEARFLIANNRKLYWSILLWESLFHMAKAHHHRGSSSATLLEKAEQKPTKKNEHRCVVSAFGTRDLPAREFPFKDVFRRNSCEVWNVILYAAAISAQHACMHTHDVYWTRFGFGAEVLRHVGVFGSHANAIKLI